MMKISLSRMSLKRVANILMNYIIVSLILFIENSSASSMDTGLKDCMTIITVNVLMKQIVHGFFVCY